MTFQQKVISPFKIDVLRADDTSTAQIGISGSIVNTSATISSNQLILPSGSHWRIICSGGQRYSTANYAHTTLQIYDATDAQYIGQKGNCTGWESIFRGRSAACALILNSEISTSKTLEFYYQTPISGTWVRNTVDMYQFISLVVMELPA